MLQSRFESKIYSFAVGCKRGFHNCFRKGWMRMHRAAELSRCGFERLSQHNFRNQISRVMSDNLASNHFTILSGSNDFNKTLSLIYCYGLAVGAERDPPDLNIETTPLGLCLAEPHAGNFRFAINASWYGQQVEARLTDTGHNLN